MMMRETRCVRCLSGRRVGRSNRRCEGNAQATLLRLRWEVAFTGQAQGEETSAGSEYGVNDEGLAAGRWSGLR